MTETYELADLEPRPFGRTITFRFTHCLEHDAHAIDALGQMMAMVARSAWKLGDRQTAEILANAADTVIMQGLDGLASGWAGLQRGFWLHENGADGAHPEEATARLLRVVSHWLERRAEFGSAAGAWGETTVVISRSAPGKRTLLLDIRPVDAVPPYGHDTIGSEVAVSDTLPLDAAPAADGAPAFRRVYRLDVDRNDRSHRRRIREIATRLDGLARRADAGGNLPLARLIDLAVRDAAGRGLDGALASWSTLHLAVCADRGHDDCPVLAEGEEALLEMSARWVAHDGGPGPRRIEHELAVVGITDYGDDRREIAVETLLATPFPA